jgi:hypothetical protein
MFVKEIPGSSEICGVLEVRREESNLIEKETFHRQLLKLVLPLSLQILTFPRSRGGGKSAGRWEGGK